MLHVWCTCTYTGRSGRSVVTSDMFVAVERDSLCWSSAERASTSASTNRWHYVWSATHVPVCTVSPSSKVTNRSVFVATEQTEEVVELVELAVWAQVLDVVLHCDRSLHEDVSEDGRLQRRHEEHENLWTRCECWCKTNDHRWAIQRLQSYCDDGVAVMWLDSFVKQTHFLFFRLVSFQWVRLNNTRWVSIFNRHRILYMLNQDLWNYTSPRTSLAIICFSGMWAYFSRCDDYNETSMKRSNVLPVATVRHVIHLRAAFAWASWSRLRASPLHCVSAAGDFVQVWWLKSIRHQANCELTSQCHILRRYSCNHDRIALLVLMCLCSYVSQQTSLLNQNLMWSQ